MVVQAPRNGFRPALSRKKTRKFTDYMPIETRQNIAVALADRGWYREADRFCNCGNTVHKFRGENSDMIYGIRETCKSRLCDRCSESQFRRFRDNGLSIISTLPKDSKRRVSFLTLTFKTRPLTTAHIRSCEKAVRRFVNVFYGRWLHRFNKGTDKFTKTKNRIDCGAVAVLEIGKSGNVHFHLLVYGYFHPLKFMSRIWTKITGDSYRIDIRQVSQSTKDSPKYAIEYIMKYMRKPPTFAAPIQYVNHLELLKGIRRLHTYGAFYNNPGWKKDREPFECPFTGEKLFYVGPAAPGEVVLSYWTIADEFMKCKDGATLHRLLKGILSENEAAESRAGPALNPALDSSRYREPEFQTEKPISRIWCYRSAQISLDSLI